ncbi:glycosyltransferase family 71 protein [[Candida] arabinofermentans NRRL YB-2248]|uniref:Glycosyltransferase family 71 protein n=1 Tax=[Candida] arabinofermentans NRRL YB-2248 TaxID=983967 RepID=A0A1E4ST57_9ASCO|nr:glycosyltransferase family 71 protein [[Candida] arabinofermentans NRRL YB-2248]
MSGILLSPKVNRLLFKLTRKKSIVISIISIILLTGLIIILSLTPLKTQQEKINASLIRQLTSSYQLRLKPKCDRFTSYKQDSNNYWQYYGYDDYDIKLTQNELLNLLNINDNQELELTKIHEYLLNFYLTEKNPIFNNYNELYNNYYTNDVNLNGIVYVSGKDYYWLTIISIKYIRDVLRDKTTPIEIFIPYYDKSDDLICSKINSVFKNIHCSYFSHYLSVNTIKKFKGYQYKSLALLLSRFTNVLYLDSDNILIESPINLFKSEKFLNHGMISWPDFWKRSTNPIYYKTSGLEPIISVVSSTPSVESGEILINKKTHIKTLLLSYYYNLFGPDYFYPLFSQGFPGEGDKETFYLASRVINEGSFLITGTKTKIVGYINNFNNQFFGQSILQRNPDNFNKFSFFHCNYPKLQIDKLDKSYFYDDLESNNRRRSWQIIRDAKKDNNGGGLIPLKKGIKIDLELKIWEIMFELLDKDFNGFELFESSSNSDNLVKIKENIFFLKNQGSLIL